LTHAEAERTMRQEAHAGLWDANLVSEFFALLEKEHRAA